MPCGVQEYGTANTRDSSIHRVQARGQGMYKILNYTAAIAVIKMLAAEHRGEAKICSPREQKRCRTEQLDVGSGNWTIPMCVATMHAVSCLARLLQPVPPTNKGEKSPYITERGKLKLPTEEGSLLRITFHYFNCLRKSLFIIVSCQ